MYGESERGYTYLDCLNDSWFINEELALKALKNELNNKLNSLYSITPCTQKYSMKIEMNSLTQSQIIYTLCSKEIFLNEYNCTL